MSHNALGRKLIMVLFTMAIALCFASPLIAGPVFLTGHDPDFHAQDSAGARNLLKSGLSFVTNGTYDDGVGQKFLWVESRIAVPGGHRIGEAGLNAIGLQLGVHYDRANAQEFATADLSQYTAVAIASSFGGILSRAELDALIARKDDLKDFINGGGGLFAAAECSPCGANLLAGQAAPDLYGFLPIEVSSVPPQAPFQVTAFGAAAPFSLVNGDVNDPTHNSFGLTGGLEALDRDQGEQATTIAGVAFVGTGLSQIILTPEAATHQVGEQHAATAKILDSLGAPVVEALVDFKVTAGPNDGDSGTGTTSATGEATFTYTGDGGVGTDTLIASFVDSDGTTQSSNEAEIQWVTEGGQGPTIKCLEPAVPNDTGFCSAAVACFQIASCLDSDGSVVAVECAPASPYPVGTTQVTITCSDGDSTATVACPVQVHDVESPQIVCPANLQLECPAVLSPEATGTPTATDNCAVASTSFADLVVPGCGGTALISRTWSAFDAAENSAGCVQTITTVDTTPPVVACDLARHRIWPPNHKFINAGLSFTAVDACDPARQAIDLGVTSDEDPSEELGAGGPTHCPDASIVEDQTVWLRAERSGLGDGRVYSVSVTATDACGNAAACFSDAQVPHDNSRKQSTVDSGQIYDATVCQQDGSGDPGPGNGGVVPGPGNSGNPGQPSDPGNGKSNGKSDSKGQGQGKGH
jgi:hypothetical protein